MKNIKSVVITALILTVICAVSAAGLAFTNDLTAGRIAELDRKAQEIAMQQILPNAQYESKTTVVNGNNVEYSVALSEGNTVGYIFTTVTKGYKGDVKVMTGVDTEGKVVAVQILSASDETPGLGQNITKDSFVNQFKGANQHVAVGDGKIDSVTGATISSNAVVRCVNEAIDLYGKVEKEGVQ